MTVVGIIVFAVIVVGVIYLARRRNMKEVKLGVRREKFSSANTLCYVMSQDTTGAMILTDVDHEQMNIMHVIY